MADIQVTGSPAVFNENVTFYSDVNIERLNVSSTSNLSAINVSGISNLNNDVYSTGSITLTNTPIVRNIPTITSNYTVTSTYNEMSVGPITIASGITVTVNSGATWSIV
jgi:hypothetical protein